jgi:hypothetical protein
MHTLSNSVDLAETIERLSSLEAEDRGLWGIMNAHEMICHLRGAFRVAMGEIPVAPVSVPMPRTAFKFIVLWSPIPWRKNFATVPPLRRGKPTMQVAGFEMDRSDVVSEPRRFCRAEQTRVDHPHFGPMSVADWMRWGYLHTDHHLRQFGR